MENLSDRLNNFEIAHDLILMNLTENPPQFIHEIKVKCYDVIGVNVFHAKINEIHKKTDNSVLTILLKVAFH